MNPNYCEHGFDMNDRADPPCPDCEAEYQAELAHDEGRCGGSLKGTCRICEKAFDRAQERWGLDHFYGPGTSAEGRV